MKKLVVFISLFFSIPGFTSLLTEQVSKNTKVLFPIDKPFSSRHNVFDYHPAKLFLDKSEKASVVSHLAFPLFDDRIVSAKQLKHYFRPDGKLVWQGKVVGEQHSSVKLIATQTRLTGNIRVAGKLYQLRTQSDGSVLISEFLQPDTTEPDGFNARNLVYQQGDPHQISAPVVNSYGFSEEPEINVLVYYTSQALDTEPDLLELIDLEFIDTNESLANSGIDAKVVVVQKIAIDESNFYGKSRLTAMYQQTGVFAHLQRVRQKFQADLVHFYSRSLGTHACGQAFYAAYPNGVANPNAGLAVTSTLCLGNLTTAHEIGHNFGAAHDRYVENGGGEADQSNYGHVDLENRFMTLMSYSDKCFDAEVNCTAISHFSNPDITYGGVATGIAETQHDSANNALMLNNAALSLANFRGGKCAANCICQSESNRWRFGELASGEWCRWLSGVSLRSAG